MFQQKKNYFVAILTAFFITMAVGASPSQAMSAVSQVGYVDFIYLVNQHPDTEQANAALKTEQEAAKKEFESKAAGLSDKEKLELDRRLGLQLEQKRLDLLQKISAKVVTAANEVAKEKGLSIVISKNEVVCGGVDVTADVLKKITGK